jgi:hypothetical protein
VPLRGGGLALQDSEEQGRTYVRGAVRAGRGAVAWPAADPPPLPSRAALRPLHQRHLHPAPAEDQPAGAGGAGEGAVGLCVCGGGGGGGTGALFCAQGGTGAGRGATSKEAPCSCWPGPHGALTAAGCAPSPHPFWQCEEEEGAARLFEQLRASLGAGPVSLCIKPAHECGGLGVMRASSGLDLLIYVQASAAPGRAALCCQQPPSTRCWRVCLPSAAHPARVRPAAAPLPLSRCRRLCRPGWRPSLARSCWGVPPTWRCRCRRPPSLWWSRGCRRSQ